MGHDFCRLWLREVMVEVRKYTTAKQRKAAWAYKSTLQFEFHGPNDYYYHGMNDADCLTSAKAAGWESWLKKFGTREERNHE